MLKLKRLSLIVMVALLGITFCKKPIAKVVVSEKSKQLVGKTWVYDTEATRVTVMQKAHDSLGGGIKNIKDIKLGGDVKKMADALSARSLFFAEDKQGRGVGFVLTEGKGLLTSKTDGWATWNADETVLTLEPTDKKRKPMIYTVQEIKPNRLVILGSKSQTETPEIYTR